jgi:predicted ATPase
MTTIKAISRIEVKAFRSLDDVDVRLGGANLLIGPNGSGKSNVLGLLHMVMHIATQSLEQFVSDAGGASALLRYGSETTSGLSLRLEFQQDDGTSAYAATLGRSAGNTLRFLKEAVEHRPPNTPDFTNVANYGGGHRESRLGEALFSRSFPDLAAFNTGFDFPRASSSSVAAALRSWLSSMRFHHFHDASSSSPLRQDSPQADDHDLRSDGGNLAAVLHRLANSPAADDIASWKRIEKLFSRIFPNVKQLVPDLVDPASPPTSALCLRWIDDFGHTFGVEALSGGALRALALITALSQPVSRLPTCVCIDEPELGLHPAALTLLAGLVRSVAPRCQIVIATQSPALLDEFTADEVIVAERREGATNLRRLDTESLKAGWKTIASRNCTKRIFSGVGRDMAIYPGRGPDRGSFRQSHPRATPPQVFGACDPDHRDVQSRSTHRREVSRGR